MYQVYRFWGEIVREVDEKDSDDDPFTDLGGVGSFGEPVDLEQQELKQRQQQLHFKDILIGLKVNKK